MPEEIRELDVVALIKDLPVQGLSRGQAGTVVYVHDQGEAFEVEFIVEPRRSVVATVKRGSLLKLKGLGYTKVAG